MDSDLDYVHELINHAEILMNQKDWDILIPNDQFSETSLESKQFCDFFLPHYRAKVTIHLPKEQLVKIVWDSTLESARLDDPGIIILDVIESGNNYKIRRQVNDFGLVCWPRETVFVQHRIDDHENDVTWIIGYSIDHPNVPITNKYVRTDVAITAFKYIYVTPRLTIVKKLINVDPKGAIPKFLITSQTKKLVDALNRWETLSYRN